MLERGHGDREDFATSDEHTPLDAFPGFRHVSRDMEDIFGPATASNEEGKPRGTEIVVLMSTRPRRRLRLSAMTLPLAALGGLALCAGLCAVLASLDEQAPAKAAIASTTSPASMPPPPARASVPAAIARAVPATQAKPAPLAKAVPVEKPEKKIAPVPEPARIAKAAASIESCSRMKREARALCMRPHVTRADDAMRRAYARALARGVKPATLRSYRNRWDNVMRRRMSDPIYVTESLPDMARRLDDKRPSRS